MRNLYMPSSVLMRRPEPCVVRAPQGGPRFPAPLSATDFWFHHALKNRWQDSTHLTEATTLNDPVGAWEEVRGGRYAIQATSDQRLFIGANGVESNGTSGNLAFTVPATTVGRTMLLVGEGLGAPAPNGRVLAMSEIAAICDVSTLWSYYAITDGSTVLATARDYLTRSAIAVTLNAVGDAVKMYVNGTLADTRTMTAAGVAAMFGSGSVYIAGRNGGDYSQTNFREVAFIVDRVYSDAEVAAWAASRVAEHGIT